LVKRFAAIQSRRTRRRRCAIGIDAIHQAIEIVVREIRGRQVRLGISAPQGLAVYREELYQQIAQEGGKGGDGSEGDGDDGESAD